MRAFLDELRAGLRLPVTSAAWVFLTVLMALSGPFGSYQEVPLAKRLLFWLVVTALAIVLALSVRVLVYTRLGLGGLWPAGVVTSAVVAAMLTWPLHALMRLDVAVYPLLPPTPLELALFIFSLTLGFCAIRHAIEQAEPMAAPAMLIGQTPQDPPPAPPPPRLLGRLAPGLRGAVWRVSGRDHYVDVLTERGSGSVLMRFSDAIAELDGMDGEQVHRSHWVAAHAVAGAEREGGRVFLELVCGERVPVSRTYLPQVERRGWLGQA
jgi:hypothetical protein